MPNQLGTAIAIFGGTFLMIALIAWNWLEARQKKEHG